MERKVHATCSTERVTGGGIGVSRMVEGSPGGCLANISFKTLAVGRVKPMEVRD